MYVFTPDIGAKHSKVLPSSWQTNMPLLLFSLCRMLLITKIEKGWGVFVAIIIGPFSTVSCKHGKHKTSFHVHVWNYPWIRRSTQKAQTSLAETDHFGQHTSVQLFPSYLQMTKSGIQLEMIFLHAPLTLILMGKSCKACSSYLVYTIKPFQCNHCVHGWCGHNRITWDMNDRNDFLPRSFQCQQR